MKTAYQYRLRPSSDQIALMDEWLELLRKQYNYRLGERFSWYEQNRCDLNACPLSCYLPELRDNPDFYSQKRDLIKTKAMFPEYAEIHSQVLQDCIARVSNQRKDFHYKTAKKLLSQGKHVAHEKLNIKGLAKSRLAKSVTDAGWGQFLQILRVKAEKAGLLAIAVNPNGTSQDCSNCGYKVKKELSDRWHFCSNCGCSLDRDHNAARNIKYRAVGHSVLKAHLTSEAIAGVDEKPALYA